MIKLMLKLKLALPLLLCIWLASSVERVEAGHGYFYGKPSRIMPPLSMFDGNASLLVDPAEGGAAPMAGPPAGAMADFIDDLVSEHKEQIITSILGSNAVSSFGSPAGGGSQAVGGLTVGGLAVDGLAVGANKAFSGNKCASCTCGLPNVNRIVGGSEVRTNKYPWIAQMIRASTFFCGGTLINDRYVLTAAHCVYGMNARQFAVRLLQLDRSSSSQGIMRNVAFAHMHAQYSPTTLVNDIALLKLDKPVPLTDPIRPVCLPSSEHQNFDFKKSIVAGWGLLQEDGTTSSVLQEVTVPIITNAQCRATSYSSMIVDTMMCAGYVKEGGKDACQGDSGGPLIVQERRIFRLAGVVSYGYGCAQPDAPGVYTRVSRYLNWIAANTRDACYCSK